MAGVIGGLFDDAAQRRVLRVKMFSAKAMGDFLTSDERTLFP